jgi:hypothetical protein
MYERESTTHSRRELLKLGGRTAAAAPSAAAIGAQQRDAGKAMQFPRRPLGKAGAIVTIINQGTWRASGIDRRLKNRSLMAEEIAAWENARNARNARIHWTIILPWCCSTKTP